MKQRKKGNLFISISHNIIEDLEKKFLIGTFEGKMEFYVTNITRIFLFLFMFLEFHKKM